MRNFARLLIYLTSPVLLMYLARKRFETIEPQYEEELGIPFLS
jgi:hypothetical protein